MYVLNSEGDSLFFSPLPPPPSSSPPLPPPPSSSPSPQLVRPAVEEVIRHSRHLVRRQRFRELAAADPVEALSFLKTTLASTVDHSNKEESEQVPPPHPFHNLTSSLSLP